MSAVETTRTVTYEANVGLQLQQTQPKIAGFAAQGSHVGPKVQLEDLFGAATPQDKDTRNGTTKTSDLDITRRWLAKPKERYFNHYIDNDDTLETSIDLKGPYTMAGAATIQRVKDEAWLLGYYKPAITGEEGATSVPFKAANVLPVATGGGGTGLTIAKIMAGLEILRGNHVDLDVEKPVIPVTSKQITDLLKQIEITSTDFNPRDKQALQEGIVREILGCLFVPIEFGNAASFKKAAPLTLDGNGDRLVPMFVPSGMHLGTWQALRAHVGQRWDMEGSWQIFAGTTVGATRMNEDKCLLLTCKEN
ncbi:MAG TPA: phage capsid protein [Allosphingosinicella sp.]